MGSLSDPETGPRRQEVPSDYYPLTSVSDTMIESLGRLLQIAALVTAHRAAILETTRPNDRERMCHDLDRVGGELRAMAGHLTQVSEEVRAVLGAVWTDVR